MAANTERAFSMALLVVTAAVVGCSSSHERTARQSAPAQALSASAEAGRVIGQLRSEFVLPAGARVPERAVIGPEAVTRFESDGARVRAVLPAVAAGSTAKLAQVELPLRASDAARVEDATSHVGVEFALEQASPKAKLAIASGVALYADALGKGEHLLDRPYSQGVDDYVVFPKRPAHEQIDYRVSLVHVAGLRLVENVLELLDARGAPRLRVKAPSVVDSNGATVTAHLALEGCAYDTDPRAPWGRKVTAPGADVCTLRVSWNGAALAYPAIVDPAWTTTGSTFNVHILHTANLLPNGDVLVAGGCDGSNNETTCELYDPTSGTWATTGALNVARSTQASVELPNGDVWVGGGGTAPNGCSGYTPTNTDELYDPSTGKWTLKATMPFASGYAPAVLLSDKTTIVYAGGQQGGGSTNKFALYDTATDTWTSETNTLGTSRCQHAMFQLPSGKVIVIGGWSCNGTVYGTTELLDLSTMTWSFGPPLATPRFAFGAIALPGKILVAGGITETATCGGECTGSAELLDDSTLKWSAAGSLSVRRSNFPLTALSSGKILAAGGLLDCYTPQKVADVFDPSTTSWSAIASMNVARDDHSVTALGNGTVLVVDGRQASTSCETYALQSVGAACASNADCVSGFCVTGVCCSTACNGTCQSCKAATKQSGSGTGTCGPAKQGTDPQNSCKDDGSPSCGNDGLCDGNGACEKYPVSTGCKPESCTSGADCTSGACADGICCDSACTGPCVACTAAKKGFGVDGVCENVVAGTNPRGACTKDPGYPSSCKSDGECDGNGACRTFAVTGTPCGATTCSNGSISGLQCNGGGQCVQQTNSCAPYIACKNGATCQGTCKTDNDCVSADYCANGTCQPKHVNGTSCQAGKECQSGLCVDSYCCSSACTGQCEACDVAPNQGTCVPVSGPPHGARPQCPGAADAGVDGGTSACDGTCNGVDTAACSFPPASTVCSITCSNGAAQISTCDGQGRCGQPKTQTCAPYACEPTSGCKTSCQVNGDCGTGYACTKGTCVPQTTGSCTDDHTVKNPDGTTTDCTPYRCQSGACLTSCSSVADCVLPATCDSTSRTCVAPTNNGSQSSGGCGCRTAGGTGSRGDGGAWIFAAIGLLVFRRRRRRACR